MKRTYHRIAIASVLALLVFGALVPASDRVPVTRAQGDGFDYTIVGGVDQAQTFDDQMIDDFTITDFTFESLYPNGMEARVTITPPEGVTIRQVVLFYEFATGYRGRVPAQLGAAPDEWIARPYEGGGLPPWHDLRIFWRIRVSEDESVETEPVSVVYYDASREWFRTENDVVIVYWYGMPVELGQVVAEAMTANWPRYIAAFGSELPYKVLSIIYPPGPDWNEFKADTSVDDTDFGATGQLFSDAASSVQRVRTLEPAAVRAECIWNRENPTVEYQMDLAASTVMHEAGHVHQQEFGVLRGPTWWVEGQATFFESFEDYPIHERLSVLATLLDEPFPTFHGNGPSGGPYTASADGCTHLVYDMGASFQQWLVAEKGGMDAYRAVIMEIGDGASVVEALETVYAQTFLELENEWRAFLGIAPVAPEQLDPALALDAPAEPFLAEGEQVVLPATPFSQPLYTEPDERSIANGACFANSPATVLRAGNDGITNWYEVDCMGLVGWMTQAQLLGTQ